MVPETKVKRAGLYHHIVHHSGYWLTVFDEHCTKMCAQAISKTSHLPAQVIIKQYSDATGE